MAKKTKSGTDIGQVQKQNAGQYGTEFASQTNAQEVKSQNQKAANSSQSSQGQYGTEFASQTDVQKVKNKTNKLNQIKANHKLNGLKGHPFTGCPFCCSIHPSTKVLFTLQYLLKEISMNKRIHS